MIEGTRPPVASPALQAPSHHDVANESRDSALVDEVDQEATRRDSAYCRLLWSTCHRNSSRIGSGRRIRPFGPLGRLAMRVWRSPYCGPRAGRKRVRRGIPAAQPVQALVFFEFGEAYFPMASLRSSSARYLPWAARKSCPFLGAGLVVALPEPGDVVWADSTNRVPSRLVLKVANTSEQRLHDWAGRGPACVA
jgi:hypothetical protein